MKHNASLDVANDLRVRGQVQDNIRVQDEVEASHFYARDIGEVKTPDITDGNVTFPNQETVTFNPGDFYLTPSSEGRVVVNIEGDVGGGGGVTDHGALTGLADDDHTQYSLADGTRAFTGHVRMDDTLNVENAVTAEAFYLTTGGDLSEDFISFQIETPIVKSFFFDSDAVFPYEVTRVSLRCESGNATAGFYIRAEGESGTGVGIVGLDPFYISPIRRRSFPISANVVNASSELYMSVFETTAAVDIRGTIKFRRRGPV